MIKCSFNFLSFNKRHISVQSICKSRACAFDMCEICSCQNLCFLWISNLEKKNTAGFSVKRLGILLWSESLSSILLAYSNKKKNVCMHSLLPAKCLCPVALISWWFPCLDGSDHRDSQVHFRYVPLNQHSPYCLLAYHAGSLGMSALVVLCALRLELQWDGESMEFTTSLLGCPVASWVFGMEV